MVSYDEVSVGLYNYFLLKDVYFSKFSMLQDDFCAVSPYKDGNDFFQNYCLSTTCFLSWRIGKRNVSWILFLMFMSLFVMYMSPVQQIISWIRCKWCFFFLFFSPFFLV